MGNTQREIAFLCQYFLLYPLRRPGVMWPSCQPGRAPELLAIPSRAPHSPREMDTEGHAGFQTGLPVHTSGSSPFLAQCLPQWSFCPVTCCSGGGCFWLWHSQERSRGARVLHAWQG